MNVHTYKKIVLRRCITHTSRLLFSRMENREQPDDFLIPFLGLLRSVFAAVLVETLLYGVHLVLFCTCAYILFTRKNPAQLVLLLSAITMFALATADISLSFRLIIDDVPAVQRGNVGVDVIFAHVYPKIPIFVTNNLIADALLLYRCYMVWRGRKWVILASVVLLIIDTVWGYVGTRAAILSLQTMFTPVYLWTVFAMNIVMTIVTAGRIWWLARNAGAILGKQQTKRYYTAVAILVESGAIYSIAVMLLVVAPPRPYRLILATIVMRVVGIMPTLMIVQVELSKQARLIRSDSVVLSTIPPRDSVLGDGTPVSSIQRSMNDLANPA